ncbi:MAG TPA: phosphatase PAP2 family protein [Gemmatimonadales bacterium]|nr:phosphatase PAP2 family protein [Gemmatimonadales bacterium]
MATLSRLWRHSILNTSRLSPNTSGFAPSRSHFIPRSDSAGRVPERWRTTWTALHPIWCTLPRRGRLACWDGAMPWPAAFALPWAAPLVLGLAGTVAATRVALRVHHVSDVVAGFTLGGVAGVLTQVL